MTDRQELEALASDRVAFEKAYKHLDLTLDKDGWGRPKYKHDMCHALWEGWQRGREALRTASPAADREEVARKICDGFTNGNIQFDEADEALRHSCLMAADALSLRATTPGGDRPAQSRSNPCHDCGYNEPCDESCPNFDDKCPNCNDANKYGDYEGPTCEVCGGSGRLAPAATPGAVAEPSDAENSTCYIERSEVRQIILKFGVPPCNDILYEIDRLKIFTRQDFAHPAPSDGAIREALTPSAETKAAYIGEFHFTVPDGHGERRVTVPWDTIKEIMKAIRERSKQWK